MEKNEDKLVKKKIIPSKKNIFMICILFILIVVALILKMQEKKQEDFVSSGEPIEVTMLEIKTLYGNLKYPSTFKDIFVYEETIDGDVVIEDFYSMVSDEKIKMFTVYFCKPEVGTLLGYIQKDGEKIPVSIQMSENVLNEDYAENQKKTYYQMVDGVNDVIASITSFDAFIGE